MLPAQICFYEGSILSAVQYAKEPIHHPVARAHRLQHRHHSRRRSALSAHRHHRVRRRRSRRRHRRKFSSSDLRRRPRRREFSSHLQRPPSRLLAVLEAFRPHHAGALALLRGRLDHPRFGSYLQPASITWLSYGKTLMRVPLGVVGQAIGVASFPILAQLYSEKKFDELNESSTPLSAP